MKLTKFKEKNHKKLGIILFTISCLLLVTIVFLYKSFALFETSEIKNIIHGQVQDSGDLYFAFYVNDTLQKEMPSKDSGLVLDEKRSYCGVAGEKDENIQVSLTENYVLQVSGITSSRTKCTLYFTKGKFILGKGVPLVESGSGLYEVNHDKVNGTTNDEGFRKPELRYAGNNYKDENTDYVHNYITFNDELWRIIGLVNVQTESGMTQRLKIIRNESITTLSWDYKIKKGSSIGNLGSNDWTDSTQMQLLNGIYYYSQIGDCYHEGDKGVASSCDFTDKGVRGLHEQARNMVAKDIIWNIAAIDVEEITSVSLLYDKERGTSTYENSQLKWERPIEWKMSNTRDKDGELSPSTYQGVGLVYPSDYIYGTSGGSVERNECFQKGLSEWPGECSENDWLKPSSNHMPTISPNKSSDNYILRVASNGELAYLGSVISERLVYPVVFLSKEVQIKSGDGSIEKPFILSLQ